VVTKGRPAAAYVLSLAAAVLLAVTSVAGLLAGTRGLYQPDPKLLPQFLGQDAVSLLLALPLLLAAMARARRGSVRGLLLWTGMLFYIVYWYYFYVAGVRFGPLFPVHIALVSTAFYGLLALLARIDAEAVRRAFAPTLRARTVGGVLVAVGVLFVLLWMGDIVRRLRAGEPIDAVSRQVYAIDLTLMLPMMIAVGIGLWRRTAWGITLAGLVLVKVVATMLLLLVNSVLVARWGQPVSAGQTVAYGITLIVVLACTVAYLRAVRPVAVGGASSAG
jgi:hypothetical protein